MRDKIIIIFGSLLVGIMIFLCISSGCEMKRLSDTAPTSSISEDGTYVVLF